MTELQIAGIIIITTSILSYILAIYIKKSKNYHYFSGWDEEKITDKDACGAMLCKGLKVFSIVLGVGGILLLLLRIDNEISAIIIIITSSVLSIIALLYYVLKAKKLFQK